MIRILHSTSLASNAFSDDKVKHSQAARHEHHGINDLSVKQGGKHK
jgi:hypothetical protein